MGGISIDHRVIDGGVIAAFARINIGSGINPQRVKESGNAQPIFIAGGKISDDIGKGGEARQADQRENMSARAAVDPVITVIAVNPVNTIPAVKRVVAVQTPNGVSLRP